ncbi:hypothetical protein JT06_02500 [Desulfobulbus sp. Tol-SR]|jgi:hypothetical protein|nr:hypothetical protein JT06_02500 [Desulfobulbus sp. Tol-SR]
MADLLRAVMLRQQQIPFPIDYDVQRKMCQKEANSRSTLLDICKVYYIKALDGHPLAACCR